MVSMRSEPVKTVVCYLIGGPADGQYMKCPITVSGYPKAIITMKVTSVMAGMTIVRHVPYRLEKAVKPGKHSEAGFRYVCVSPNETMPEHDWDGLLSELDVLDGGRDDTASE